MVQSADEILQNAGEACAIDEPAPSALPDAVQYDVRKSRDLVTGQIHVLETAQDGFGNVSRAKEARFDFKILHGNIHNVRVPRFEIGKRGFKPTGKREGIGLRMKRGTRGMVFRPVRLCLEGSIDLRVEFAEPCRVCADDASIVFHLHGANVTGQRTRHLVEGTLDPLVGIFSLLVRPESAKSRR